MLVSLSLVSLSAGLSLSVNWCQDAWAPFKEHNPQPAADEDTFPDAAVSRTRVLTAPNETELWIVSGNAAGDVSQMGSERCAHKGPPT